MLIKVYNKETLKVETIDVKNLDKTKHYHRNTQKEFTNEELKSFWIEEKKELPKK